MATASSQNFPPWLAREERLAEREPVGVAATVSGAGGSPEPAEVTDASPLGCRVRTTAPGGVGAFLTIAAGEASVTGWVAWRRGDVLGLDFARPLDEAALAAFTGPDA